MGISTSFNVNVCITRRQDLVLGTYMTVVIHSSSAIPCGGGVEYLHRSPMSRRRRRKRKSRIWDSKIWSRVRRDSDPRVTALARASSSCNGQIHPLPREDVTWRLWLQGFICRGGYVSGREARRGLAPRRIDWREVTLEFQLCCALAVLIQFVDNINWWTNSTNSSLVSLVFLVLPSCFTVFPSLSHVRFITVLQLLCTSHLTISHCPPVSK
jgi:hypothetical protein